MFSLRRRLLISSTLLLVVFLGVMWFGLNQAFERSVLTAAKDSLRNQVMLLMASVDVENGAVTPPTQLSEPRLQQPDSDLFAQLFSPMLLKSQADNDKTVSENARQRTANIIWRSPSLLDRSLPSSEGQLGKFQFTPSQSWQGQSLNFMTLAVEWETELGMVPFVVQVAESDLIYKQRLLNYQRQVGLWLAVFASALIVLLLFMLGWALTPLERVRKQVNEIESGLRRRLDENYPLEVSQLTQNINQLLSFEEQQIERHREVLGNLAHSLKTPIAVLNGLQFPDENKLEAQAQLSSMQTIIDYQLKSASAVGRRRFSQGIRIDEISKQIVRSLEKIHSTKNVNSRLTIEPDLLFYGDQGDWMEVLGNLADNAFKWSDSRVEITISNVVSDVSKTRKTSVNIIVQDDGPGIDVDLKKTIVQRGVRLDTKTPGHGLGLHIVGGILDAYDGSLTVSNSDFDSGTKFSVTF